MTRKPEAERATLTIPEVADRLGISRNAAYEAARRGEIPTIRLGKLLRVPRAQLERLLAGGIDAGPKEIAPRSPASSIA